MKPRSRIRSTLVVALVAHAAVAVWAWRATWWPSDSELSKRDDVATELDIAVEAPVTPPGDVEPSEVTPAERAAGESTRALAYQTGAATGAGPRGEAAPGGAPSSEAAATAPDGTWTFSPTTGGTSAPGGSPLAGGALGSAVHDGVAATVAEDTRKREEFARKHVLPIYGQRDVELGLAPGGALVSLAHDLVSRSRVPLNGRALLQFDTDGAGIVASVRILEASSGRAEWAEVASEIAAAARNKPLKVPPGARGVAVTLEVTSKTPLPEGTIGKAMGIISDPIGAAANATEALGGGKNPVRRVIASHVVDVQAF